MKNQNDPQTASRESAALDEAELCTVQGGMLRVEPRPSRQYPPYWDILPTPEPKPRPLDKWLSLLDSLRPSLK